MAQRNTKITQAQKLEWVRRILEPLDEIHSETESLMLLLAGDADLKKHFDDDHFLEVMEQAADSLLTEIQKYRQELNPACKRCGSDLDLTTRLCTDTSRDRSRDPHPCPYTKHQQDSWRAAPI